MTSDCSVLSPQARGIAQPIARWVLAACALATVLAESAPARANARHFAFLYESGTLPHGVGELEPQTTLRVGRDGENYLGLDERFECEYGLTDRLQTSIYVNGTEEFVSGATNGSTNGATATFGGLSSEWKFNILRLGEYPIGLAAYFEATVSPTLIELEGKIIADARIDRLFVAANLVYEHEWILASGSATPQIEFEADLGVGWFVTPRVMVGFEGRLYHRALIDPEFILENQSLFLGPVVSVSFNHFWVVAAVTPQWVAFTGASPNEFRDLNDEEAMQARVIVGTQF